MNRRTYLAVTTVSLASVAGCTRSSDSSQPSSVDEDNVTQYSQLSVPGQRLFDEIRANGSTTRPSTDVTPTVEAAEYIQHDGTLYAIEIDRDHSMTAEYGLAPEFVPESEVPDDAEIIAFEELPDGAQTRFMYALGNHGTDDQTKPSGVFNDYDYVKYKDRHYEPVIVVGDTPVWKLSASPVTE